jgi:glutaredoxin
MNTPKYMLVIYGKDNCPHCKELQKTIWEILHAEHKDFFADVQSLSTRKGLVAYAKAETINGQRIPALQIMKWNETTKNYEKIHDQRSPVYNEQSGIEHFPTYLQLETDYANHQYIAKEDILNLMNVAIEQGENE